MNNDDRYLQILLDRIAVCRSYRPRFGHGGTGLSMSEFRQLYGDDPFYAWFGLDNPLMYAAHRAAGGITSIYRQIGTGSEVLFRQIIQDQLDLTEEQSTWSYDIITSVGQTRTLRLDARIEPTDVADLTHRDRLSRWMGDVAQHLDLDGRVADAMRGAVFEVRQGYKSKDSKRQNADIANAAEAYTKGYLPVLVVLSTQIDDTVVERYQRGKWLVLRGTLDGSPLDSTYAFVRDVVGYDLTAFFQRNSTQLRNFTRDVLESLLRATDDE